MYLSLLLMNNRLEWWRLFVPLSIFILIGMFVGCANEKIPDDILSRQEMGEIIQDLFVVDAVVQNGRYTLLEREKIRDQLQAGVLDKYEMSIEEFLKSYDYYIEHPALLDSVHTDIIRRLNEETEKR